MIDMGFEPQVNQILSSLGGVLKAEEEEEAYRQEQLAIKGEAFFRITAMFSATMPAAVEKLARTFLRFPAIVKVCGCVSGLRVYVWAYCRSG